MRARYKADPEARRAEGRRYKEANRDRVRAYQREYHRQHPERLGEWKAANPERVREMVYRGGANRRARVRNAFVEPVSRRIVWEKHDGICGICHDPVSLREMHVDHVIPLAKGGTHSYSNTQPAHPSCNLRKGASLP